MKKFIRSVTTKDRTGMQIPARWTILLSIYRRYGLLNIVLPQTLAALIFIHYICEMQP